MPEAPDGLELGPRRGDVDGHERGEVEAVGELAAVEDEIALEGAGPNVGPVAPRAQGHLAAHRARARRGPTRLAGAPAAGGPGPPIGRARSASAFSSRAPSVAVPPFGWVR